MAGGDGPPPRLGYAERHGGGMGSASGTGGENHYTLLLNTRPGPALQGSAPIKEMPMLGLALQPQQPASCTLLQALNFLQTNILAKV